MSDQILLISGAILLIPILYVWFKKSNRCPKCNKDWSWKTSSSHNEPSATTVQKKVQGSTTGTKDTPATQTWLEETIEIGTKITEKYCSSCGNQATIRKSYRKVIGNTTYTKKK